MSCSCTPSQGGLENPHNSIPRASSCWLSARALVPFIQEQQREKVKKVRQAKFRPGWFTTVYFSFSQWLNHDTVIFWQFPLICLPRAADKCQPIECVICLFNWKFMLETLWRTRIPSHRGPWERYLCYPCASFKLSSLCFYLLSWALCRAYNPVLQRSFQDRNHQPTCALCHQEWRWPLDPRNKGYPAWAQTFVMVSIFTGILPKARVLKVTCDELMK